MELCSLLTESQCAAVCILRASAELRCTTDQCHRHLGGIEGSGLAVMEHCGSAYFVLALSYDARQTEDTAVCGDIEMTEWSV